MLLYIIRQSSADAIPEETLQPLIATARHSAARYMLLAQAQQQMERVFRKEEIPTAWIKGIALAGSVYPDPTLRPMVDLDVLVPYPKRQAALEIAQSTGYTFPRSPQLLFELDDSVTLSSSYHYHLVGGPAHAVNLELHYRLLRNDDTLLPLDQLAWFWTQTQETDDFHFLKPEAHLLYLCAHAVLQHGEAQFYLLRYYDLHLLLTNFNLDWHLIVKKSIELKWTYAVERALLLCVQMFATPIPEHVFTALRERRPADEDLSQVTSLQQADISLAKMMTKLSMLSKQDRARYVLRYIFPPPVYMRQQYSTDRRMPVWLRYPYRWLSLAQKALRAIWRHIRLRST